MDNKRLNEITMKAQYTFWQAVAEEYPEISTGDFPPELHFSMENDLKQYIASWYELNKS